MTEYLAHLLHPRRRDDERQSFKDNLGLVFVLEKICEAKKMKWKNKAKIQ